MGIFEIDDLVFHLPYRYEDRTKISDIANLKIGEPALIQGKIVHSEIKNHRRKSLLIRITDGSHFFCLRFIYFSPHLENTFKINKEIYCFGEVRRGPEFLEMVHPEYSFADSKKSIMSEHLTPTYPTTDGLQQNLLRKIIKQAMTLLTSQQNYLMDLFPDRICIELKLPSLLDALNQLHEPQSSEDTDTLLNFRHPAQKRLILEELLAHNLSLKQLRQHMQRFNAPIFQGEATLSNQFIKKLPFRLTQAQQRVIEEIFSDLRLQRPMLRLVQGDVGSGKTVVAMAAALHAIANDWQVAFMAPTELLAEQHFENIRLWATPLNICIGWLSGKVKGKQRATTLNALETGKIHLMVGTHALFQEDVTYHKLGFIIIDEQHRFGVHQRLALKNKSLFNACSPNTDQDPSSQRAIVPHQLIMTATPIPRTLAMTAYANLDISVIDELPKGRKPIETVVIPESRRQQVIQRVEEACQQGQQAYWVCPLIEESELLSCQAAEKTAENLQQVLIKLRIGLIHGRMKSEQKNDIMSAFKQGHIHLLVATSVIEVGVDVANASLMIIENAERLGLSQLHQLRGRVGRGVIQSHCVLLYQGRLSQLGRERLGIMRETNDGFVIAERDLEIRGPGELLGTKQTGLLQLRVADIIRDRYLFEDVEQAAHIMIKEKPNNIEPLINRWINQGLQYGNI